MNELDEGFIAGYACLSARADLLDRINVFPVADSDTGTNLRISLGPLRSCGSRRALVADQLYRTATGNSGNIAVSFFSEFLCAEHLGDLSDKAAKGRDKAWQAVADPRNGTMLSFFDTLAGMLARSPVTGEFCPAILSVLRKVVLETASTLADLRSAGVVDAGALGMFVFFDGFFRAVTGYTDNDIPLAELFPDRLVISNGFRPAATDFYCVDALIRTPDGLNFATETAAALGESVVVIPGQENVKIHIHTSDPEKLRKEITKLGEIVVWSDESLRLDPKKIPQFCHPPNRIHIMTDAAGSLSREMAKQYGITLLDSYIVSGDTADAESLCSPDTIYARMRVGQKVTTAQASLFERHQLYRSVCEEHGRTLYLCVGSAFTGNFATAMAWKKKHDAGNLLDIIDTGAASGRLGLISVLTARFARTGEDADAVLAHARFLADNCREYVFIDVLRYLVAGGRVSRTGGFFGDLLHMKPVISPTPAGVSKVGVVHNRESQIAFAVEKVRLETSGWKKVMILLQFSDNKDWVSEVVQMRIRTRFPWAEIVVGPLSLTSGVHMGPGTWSIAFAQVA
jgi:uncharacterized protein